MLRTLLAIVAFLPVVSAADEIKAEVGKESVLFRCGDEIVTEYRFKGDVQVEKGEGTKPLAKPYFYPLNAPGTIPVTRDWPIRRGVKGETTDHFHQKSAWFCHGDVIPEGLEMKTKSKDKNVKGVDFWSETAGHGRIVYRSLNVIEPGAKCITENEWRTPEDVPILDETRGIQVRALPAGYLICLDIQLKARDYAITFGDTKEGSLGVRMPDSFQIKVAGSKGVITSSKGSSVKAPAKDDLPLWGEVAEWHDYSGDVNGKTAGIAIFAHPDNKYASAWHTRVYGLMAANPFGRDKSRFPAMKGKTDMVRLAKGESLELRFALYVHSGDVNGGKVAEAFENFATGKK